MSQRANRNSKWHHINWMKRGKTLVTKTCLVSVVHSIGWEGSTGFRDRSRSMARKSNAITRLKIALASKKHQFTLKYSYGWENGLKKVLGGLCVDLSITKKSWGKKPKVKDIFLIITEFWKDLLWVRQITLIALLVHSAIIYRFSQA